MKKKLKIILLIIAVFLFATLCLPAIRSFVYQSMNKAFIEKIEKNALSANIKIVQQKHSFGENSEMSSVSAGASGVIIRREGSQYYALTAEHVIRELEGIDETEYIILGHDQPDLNDYLNSGGKFQGVVNYYQQFPKGVVEYANEKYDLAIIRFDAREDYAVMSVSAETPAFGDLVASISNPYKRRNVVTVGRVSTIKPRPFGDEDGEMQHPIIKHTAMISGGSSGSALLNESLEIVGINLGGGENIFRKFVNGMAMPSDRIRAFLEEWENRDPAQAH